MATGIRQQITNTYYDEALPGSILVNNQIFEQQNLRPRVASVTYTERPAPLTINNSPLTIAYDRATHYSYDIHGNVKTLVQEFKDAGIAKQLDYEYDLISGKVNQVYYQGGQADQLIHRYSYDGDNRITQVETSTNGTVWTKEVQYDYYAHGLAIAKMGAQAVETQTYAYTLQGWIKGVTGQNFSYALGYNENDYASIGANTNLATPIATKTSNGVSNSTGLYNGNIATWASLNPKLDANVWTQQFEYDQLNRIVSSSSKAAQNAATYKTGYSYDANGNIKTLNRFDALGVQFDQLGYNYEDKASGYLKNTNKLRWVDDASDIATKTDDVKDQAVDNYNYDDIGNLSKDVAEEIAKIEWTVYGKVKSVTRTENSAKPNLLFNYDASGNRISKTVFEKTGNVKTTYYLRDASGNVLSTYSTEGNSSLALEEQYLYGSNRLGVLSTTGRSYELTDHLGNVRTVVADLPASQVSENVLSATDYYPFGMTARAYNSTNYRYGFSGKEKEFEFTGDNYDFGARILDTRLGRWLAVDPVYFKSPGSTTYNYCFGNPMIFSDPSGEYPLVVITDIVTGYTNAKVYGTGGTTKMIVVPTYKMIVYDVDSKGTTTKLGEFNVTRDGWYNNGQSSNSTSTSTTTGKLKTTTTTTVTEDNLVNRTTEPVGSEVTVAAKPTTDYADTQGAYVLDPVPAVPTPAGWDVDVNGQPISNKVKRKNPAEGKEVMIHIGGYFTKGADNKIAGYYGCFGVVDPTQISPTIAAAEAKTAEALTVMYDPTTIPVGIAPSNREQNKVVNTVQKAVALAKKRNESNASNMKVTIKKRSGLVREKKIVTNTSTTTSKSTVP